MTLRLGIAGSRSLLAQALKRPAVAQGAEVVLIGRTPDADAAFDAEHLAQPLTLPPLDRLVICSASFADSSPEGARQNIQVNVLGSLALLQAAIAAGARHVTFVSSISALDAGDSYGISKATAERLLAVVCARSKVGLGILRPGQIYDAEGRGAAHQRFLYGLVDQIAAGKDVVLNGQQDVLRNYVQVEDVAAVLWRCVETAADGAFNAVHPESLRVSQVAQLIAKTFGAASHIRFDATKPDLADLVIPPDANAFAQFAHMPRSFAQGIAEIRDRRAVLAQAVLAQAV